ncbi:unnamed protein product [Closterium sp. NIES-53]
MFDHEGRPIQFDTWLDDLQLYLLSDYRDNVLLFDHRSGASLAPPDTADSATPSLWLTHDAAARLAVCNHLPLAERAHFGQHKAAKALYNAVIARYSSPTTAALGRLVLPYLFPKLSTFATVEDLITHLRTSDTRYRVALTAEFLDINPLPIAVVARTREARVVALAAGVVVVEAVEAVEVTEVVLGVVAGVGASMAARVAAVGVVVAVVAAVGVVAGGGSGGGRGVDIFALDYDAILAAIYTFTVSAEGDCYLCVPPDPGIEAAALGASESSLPGTAPAVALHTFTLDSGASCCFFHASTTLTPFPALVPVRLADPSRGPVLARSSTVLPCPAVPSSSLSDHHLPSFSTNLVSTAALQDAMVTTTTPGGQYVLICTCTRTGSHLTTFTRRPGSSLYILTTEAPQVAAPFQVSASGPVAAPCSCRLLTHQTLLWHHRLGHPSQPRLRGMHSRLLVSGLPRSLPLLPPSPAPPCLPCVEGRQRPQGYFLLVVDDYTRYTTVFPLRSKGEVPGVLIPWIRAVRLQLRDRFREDLLVLHLHSDRGGEFSSDLLRDLCRGEGILQSFTLPASSQKNGVAERRIGLVMEVARVELGGAEPTSAEPYGAEPESAEPGGADSKGAESGDAEPEGADPWGAEPEGVEHGGAESEGAESGGAEPRGTACAGGPVGASPRLSLLPEPLSLQQLCEWFARCTRLRSGAAGAGDPAAGGTRAGGAGATSPGGAGVTAGAGGIGGAGAAGPGGARTRGTGAAGAGGVGGARAGDLGAGGTGAGGTGPRDPGAGGSGAGDPGAGGAGAGGAGAGGTGAGDPGSRGIGPGDPGAGGAGAGGNGVGGAGAGGAGAGGAGAGGAGAGGARVGDPGAGGAGAGGAGGTVQRRPFFIDSLTEHHEPDSRPASLVRAVCTGRRVPRPRPPPVPGTHIMALRPSSVPLRVPLPSSPASSLADSPDSESDLVRAASPSITRLLATVVTDPSFVSAAASALVAELCRAAAVPHLVAMLLAREGDPDAPDIPTLRSYAEAITGPYSSQWQIAMDAEMTSLKSTGTYVDAVPPPWANIVDGMWIFRVKRPPGSPPVFKARYIARGFSSLHEEIWLRRPRGFTGSFPTGTQWSLRRLVYGLRHAPREWHNTLRTTLAALGFAPSTADPSLILRTDTSLLPFYILVYVDDLVFPTADIEALALVKSELQKRHTCTDLGPSALQLPVSPLHSPLLCLPVTRSKLLLQTSPTSGMGLVLGGRGPFVLTGYAYASWVDDLATQQSSQGYNFSLGSGSVSWRSTCSSSVLSSSCEAEIYAGAMAAQVLLWLTYLLTDLGERLHSTLVPYVDNKAMIALCEEHRFEHRTKHSALSYFLARELQQRGQLRLACVATRANTVDIFTKAF